MSEPSVPYSMGVLLDGYIVGPDGDFGWTAHDYRQAAGAALVRA